MSCCNFWRGRYVRKKKTITTLDMKNCDASETASDDEFKWEKYDQCLAYYSRRVNNQSPKSSEITIDECKKENTDELKKTN